MRVLPRGKHRRAAPPERLVRLQGVGPGVPELLLGPGPLPNPLSYYGRLPRVLRPSETLAPMLPGSPERVGMSMAGDARPVLVCWHHESIVCRVYLGRGAVHASQREQLARELGHEYHHGRVQGEPLGAELCPELRPDLRQVAGGRRRPLEVNVGSHISEDPGGLYLRGPCQCLPPLVRGTPHPRAA